MKILAVGAVLLVLIAPMEAAGVTRDYQVRDVDFVEEDPKGQSQRQLDVLEDKKLDYEMKNKVCIDIERALDSYYSNIKDILDKATRLDSQIKFLCNSENPENPGLRDVASYSRLDYITKCSQAEQAECELALASASMDAKVVLRKLTVNDGIFVEYKTVNAADVTKEVQNGFQRVLDCVPLEPNPYMSKRLPFNPGQLRTTCGNAGYKYYVDLAA